MSAAYQQIHTPRNIVQHFRGALHWNFVATTHVLRKVGARVAELLGATEAEIGRDGKWSQEALAYVYLSQVPRDVVQALAGQGGRATTSPCPNFPRISWALGSSGGSRGDRGRRSSHCERVCQAVRIYSQPRVYKMRLCFNLCILINSYSIFLSF